MRLLSILIASLLAMMSCQQPQTEQTQDASKDTMAQPEDSLRYPDEKHLRNIRQLTFGGDNAEAYFSFDNQQVVLQRANPKEGIPCDQIFWGKLPQSPEEDFQMQPVSNGKGRTTCSYFMPGDSLIIYASTHLSGDACPPEPDRAEIKKYVWAIYDSYEIFIADKQGNQVAQLTDNDAYDAEATLSPKGDKIVFTSTRDGDLDLYTMDLDGSNVQRVTDGLGYDGGAFFSPDGSKLVFRSSRPQTPEAQKEYRDFLARGLVAPTNMEVYICNVDGSDLQKVTELGNANWAPYFHPSGEKIIFSTNHASGGRTFNLYMVNIDGTGLERISYDSVFDAFPMFSYDGKKLLFSSNRNNGGTRETNVFIADWVE